MQILNHTTPIKILQTPISKQIFLKKYKIELKGPLPGLSQFLATERKPFEDYQNAFYFALKAPCVLKIFKFMSYFFFGHVGNR